MTKTRIFQVQFREGYTQHIAAPNVKEALRVALRERNKEREYTYEPYSLHDVTKIELEVESDK